MIMHRIALLLLSSIGLTAPLWLLATAVNGQIVPLEGIGKQDWPWWRGPMNNGEARSDQQVVTEWGPQKHVLWSIDIPGRGNGSPIVVGRSIYLAVCDETTGSQSVHAYERDTGKLQWKSVVHEAGAMRKNSKSTGASSTLACDGQKLFINFANQGAVWMTALSLAGEKVWSSKICDYQIHQGYGASPAIYQDLVIGIADTKGGGAIAAFRRDSGQLVWKRDRPSNPNYPSPIVLKIGGKDQLIMTGCDTVVSLQPSTGDTLWEIAGATTECVTSTVTDGTHVYSSGGYPKNHMSAINALGEPKVVWENKERLYVPSLLYKEGYLYAVLDAGIAVCWEAGTGKEQWKQRLGGNFSSSPVLLGDRIYAINESAEGFVFRASPEKFEAIGTGKLGDECFATPTICGGRIYLRVAEMIDGKRQEKLIAVGTK